MDFVSGFVDGRQKIPAAGLLSFTPLSAAQQSHLSRVYAVLAAGIVVTAIAVRCQLNYFALPLFLAAVGQLGCLYYFAATRHHSGDSKNAGLRRFGVFLGLSYLSGASLASLIEYADFLNPSLLPAAFFATFAVFSSFSLAAMFAKQRQFLYLGAVLGTACFYLTMTSLVNIFLRSHLVHDLSLYAGLLICMAFVLYDTQIVLYEFAAGQSDVVRHAVTFYLDVIGIFVRLLRILADREEKKQRSESKRR